MFLNSSGSLSCESIGVELGDGALSYNAFNFSFFYAVLKVTWAGDRDRMNLPFGLSSLISIYLKISFPKVRNDCVSPASCFRISLSMYGFICTPPYFNLCLKSDTEIVSRVYSRMALLTALFLSD